MFLRNVWSVRNKFIGSGQKTEISNFGFSKLFDLIDSEMKEFKETMEEDMDSTLIDQWKTALDEQISSLNARFDNVLNEPQLPVSAKFELSIIISDRPEEEDISSITPSLIDDNVSSIFTGKFQKNGPKHKKHFFETVKTFR